MATEVKSKRTIYLLQSCLPNWNDNFSTINLLMAILAYTELDAHQYAMKEFIKNLETKPLVDIKVSEAYCPQGY